MKYLFVNIGLFCVFSIYGQTASDYYNQAKTKEELKDYRKAIELYTKAIQLSPQFDSAFYGRANSRINFTKTAQFKKSKVGYQQTFQDAISDYDTAIIINPKFVSALLYRAIANNFGDAAMIDIEKVLELDPNNVLAYKSRGNYFFGTGDLEHALSDYNHCIMLDSKYAPAYFNRGLIKIDLHQRDSALSDFNKAIECDPKLAVAYYERGQLRQQSEIEDDTEAIYNAIKDFSQAIQLNPNMVEAYFSRGMSQYNLAHFEEAIKDYTSCIKLNPLHGAAYCERGNCKIRLKDNKGACKDWHKAMSHFYQPAFDKVKQYCN